MDIITDLLPRVESLKVGNTAKDGRQPKHNNADKIYQKIDSHKAEVVPLRSKSSNWYDVDRRSGKDRRKQLEQRGRWLESRDKSNRRIVESTIYLEV